MKLGNNIIKTTLLIATVSMAILGCQKENRPALGDYPIDTNPPGGPLKFYSTMEGNTLDSIRANFGTNTNASYVDGGVSGKAVQFDGSKNGFLAFPSANDFGTVSDFTISLWMNSTLDQKNHVNATSLLAFGNSQNFWGNVTIFAEHENSTSDSMPLKIHFNAANNSDNWQAAGYTDDKRLPKMYDGQWHNIVITYVASTKAYALYRDGEVFDQMIMDPAIKFENSSQLVVGGFQEAVGIVSTYGDNPWMSGFPGKMDNIRLYGTALSSGDVAALYANKQ